MAWLALILLVAIAVFAQSASAYLKFCARELESIRKLLDRHQP